MKPHFVSVGLCAHICKDEKKAVTVLHMNTCFCAETYPSRLSLVDDSYCSWGCPGYNADACGGPIAFSVVNTGLQLDVEYDGNDNASEPAATASASTSSAIANTGPTDSVPSQCSSWATTTLNGVLDKIEMAAGKLVGKIQAFFKESSEETRQLQEELDL